VSRGVCEDGVRCKETKKRQEGYCALALRPTVIENDHEEQARAEKESSRSKLAWTGELIFKESTDTNTKSALRADEKHSDRRAQIRKAREEAAGPRRTTDRRTSVRLDLTPSRVIERRLQGNI